MLTALSLGLFFLGRQQLVDANSGHGSGDGIRGPSEAEDDGGDRLAGLLVKCFAHNVASDNEEDWKDPGWRLPLQPNHLGGISGLSGRRGAGD